MAKDTKLDRLNLGCEFADPVFPVDKDGKRIGSTDSPVQTVSTEADNTETSKTVVGTWYVVPDNAKGVIVQLDATGAAVSANVEYSLDRAGVVAGTTTTVEKWANGAVTNGIKSQEFPAVAGVRMTDIVTNAVLEVKSTLTTALVGANNNIVYTSKLTGTAGDNITIAYIDPSDVGQALEIVVTGTDIVANLATDAGGLITSTADDIKTAIAAKAEAHALVGTADKAGDDGSGVVTAMVATNLANGVNAVAATLPKLYITVV